MTTQHTNKYQFDLLSELYRAGVDEDGWDHIAETYVVTATDQSGNRWRHRDVFPGCQKTDHLVDADQDFPYYFEDTRDAARKAAAALIVELEAGQLTELLPSDWLSVLPTYGSARHDEQLLVDLETDDTDRMR